MASSSSSPSSPGLASSSCKACNASSEPVASTSYASLLAQLGNTPDLSAEPWQIGSFEPFSPPGVDVLRRAFRFRNFKTAQAFAQRVGNEVAEVEKHHPALITEWGKVTVLWWTHAINGLHENDFICAAKTDEIASSAQGLKK
ncbi:transcriptional coactivator/pterin dehydratase [Acaromyces ingoldii]|uniref:4a-hydroxytetrahydrobiopterin dehydratase n=1 Tax=Acaromyces ingoldii TaxID=215250 RepID=A0A316YS94_9BASI|nr:transcriptional coactivator/pterin dehydratase [Acaromyces ingoldii]PWN92179.1 transcriptional coactivator/pterin dehydratase [Acaromyces ingoldii]